MNMTATPLSGAIFGVDGHVHPHEAAELERAYVKSLQTRVDKLTAMLEVLGLPVEASRLYSALTLQSGKDFGVKDILAAWPASLQFRDHNAVLAAMANLGFLVRQVMPKRALNRSNRRPLLVADENGAIVLLPIGQSWAVCSGTGPLEILPAGAFDETDLTFWEVCENADDSPVSQVARSHTGYSWVRALLSRFPYLGRSLIIATSVLALSGLLVPLLISAVFGQVIGLSSMRSLPALVIAFLLILCVEAFFLTQRARIVAYTANRLEFLINTASFERILFLSPFISERASPTSQAARLRSFENIRDFLVGPAFSSILDMPVALVSLGAVAYLAPAVTPVPIAAICLFALIFYVSLRSVRILTSKAADEATEMQRLAIETLDKLQAIRENGLQDAWSKRISSAVARDQNAQFRLRLAGRVTESCSALVYTSSVVFMLAAGAYSVWDGSASNVGLLAITILGLRSLLPFHTLCMSVLRFEQIRRSFSQINTLMDLPTESQGAREDYLIGPVTGRLSLVNVGFRAKDTRPVFVGLELEVEPGDIVGIYGAHGTGKTTLFKMILGMNDVLLGTVRIDGVDIRQLPLTELRRRISYIPQRPRIFPGTIKQNLLHANPLATAEQITKILERVGLRDEIEALPAGLEHLISGAPGDEFSLEFRYRFAIARALLVNSQLLLIDEIPNALLDGEIGVLLKRILTEFRGKRTILFASHRSDFLSLGDKVIALRYGRVPLIGQPKTILEGTA